MEGNQQFQDDEEELKVTGMGGTRGRGLIDLALLIDTVAADGVVSTRCFHQHYYQLSATTMIVIPGQLNSLQSIVLKTTFICCCHSVFVTMYVFSYYYKIGLI
jgi:hypothetical protein